MGDDEVTQRRGKQLPALRLEMGREETVLREGEPTADCHTFLDLAWPSSCAPAPGAGLRPQTLGC